MVKFPIAYWRHEIGGMEQVGKSTIYPTGEREGPTAGWYCWAYATHVKDETFNLEKWMKKNMTGKYDCTMRFNSGDPMYTVWIKEEKDAMFFQLSFGG